MKIQNENCIIKRQTQQLKLYVTNTVLCIYEEILDLKRIETASTIIISISLSVIMDTLDISNFSNMYISNVPSQEYDCFFIRLMCLIKDYQF